MEGLKKNFRDTRKSIQEKDANYYLAIVNELHGVVAWAYLKKHEPTEEFDDELQLEIVEAGVRKGKANQTQRLDQALRKMIEI